MFKSLTIKFRLTIVIVFLLMSLLVIGGKGGMRQAKEGLRPLYENRATALMIDSTFYRETRKCHSPA